MEICIACVVFYLSRNYITVHDAFTISDRIACPRKDINYEFDISSSYGFFLYSLYQQTFF